VSQNAIVLRDQHGVLLRYHPDAFVPQTAGQKPQPSDRERMALINAERELVTLEIVFEHLELSHIARSRLADALHAIYAALEFKRPSLGMSVTGTGGRCAIRRCVRRDCPSIRSREID
jgi:hypothetical protein